MILRESDCEIQICEISPAAARAIDALVASHMSSSMPLSPCSGRVSDVDQRGRTVDHVHLVQQLERGRLLLLGLEQVMELRLAN